MFYKKLTSFIGVFLASFGLYAKGPINVGLEASKYPINYVFSKVFDKSHIDFIMSKIEKDPNALLEAISNDDPEKLLEYVDTNYTFCSFSFSKENISKFLKPLLIKFIGTGSILAGQQIFPEHDAKKFQVTHSDRSEDLFLAWGFPVETGMRLTNNLACTGYGIKTEGWDWIKRNLVRFWLLSLSALGRLKFNNKACEWFSWTVNRFFDLKDYENYCKNTFVESIVNSRDEFIGDLQELIMSDEVSRDDNLLKIRSFIEKAYETVPVTRRIVQMDSFSKFLLAIALRVAAPEWYHEYWRVWLERIGAHDLLRELEDRISRSEIPQRRMQLLV